MGNETKHYHITYIAICTQYVGIQFMLHDSSVQHHMYRLCSRAQVLRPELAFLTLKLVSLVYKSRRKKNFQLARKVVKGVPFEIAERLVKWRQNLKTRFEPSTVGLFVIDGVSSTGFQIRFV